MEIKKFIPGGKRIRWHEMDGSRLLSSAFRFVVIIVLVFPFVFIILIKEVGRCGERPPAGFRDITELELRLINHSGSRLDINTLWWQKLRQLLNGLCERGYG